MVKSRDWVIAGTAWRTARAASCWLRLAKKGSEVNTSPLARRSGQGREHGVEVLFGAGMQNMELHAESLGRGLQVPHLRSGGGARRVGDSADDRGGPDHLLEDLQPLGARLHAQARHAREIAVRPVQAAHHAQRDGIAAHLEHDRDRRGRRFRRECHGSAAGCDEHGHLLVGQISRERRQSVVAPFRPSKLDGEVAAFDVSGFGETIAEGADAAGEGARRFRAEIPDHRHPRLLRLSGERPPSRRRPKQGHELASPHPPSHQRERSRARAWQ